MVLLCIAAIYFVLVITTHLNQSYKLRNQICKNNKLIQTKRFNSQYNDLYNNTTPFDVSTIMLQNDPSSTSGISGNSIDLFSESMTENTIRDTIKNVLNTGNKTIVVNPIDVFQQIYLDIKNKKTTKSLLTAENMLEQLFPTEILKEPFDEVYINIFLI